MIFRAKGWEMLGVVRHALVTGNGALVTSILYLVVMPLLLVASN